MTNTSGQAYGLTVLSPIQNGPEQGASHADQIRRVLSNFDNGTSSPLTKVSRTHMARFAVVDDVYFVAAPSKEEHLKSKYLFFNTNFDGDLDSYLDSLRQEIPQEINQIWEHCVGFPGVKDAAAFRDYFRRCQLENAIFFADYPDSTVSDVLRALQAQRAFISFVVQNQGQPAVELKRNFAAFMQNLQTQPPPKPGSF